MVPLISWMVTAITHIASDNCVSGKMYSDFFNVRGDKLIVSVPIQSGTQPLDITFFSLTGELIKKVLIPGNRTGTRVVCPLYGISHGTCVVRMLTEDGLIAGKICLHMGR